MARGSSTNGFSLAQLEKMMQSRRNDVARLSRKRDKLQKKLDAMNAQIAALAGGSLGRLGGGTRSGGGGAAGTRARNEVSLQDAIHQVLSKSSSPMAVGDIVAKVEAAGYRSNSANFRGIVNQTLIKDKRFVSASRGVYQLKK
jgi:hypothetical protein